MDQVRTTVVCGPAGLRGMVSLPPEEWEHAEKVSVRLEDGRTILVPPNLLDQQSDGSAILRLSTEELKRYGIGAASTAIPVAREEVHVSKRRIDSSKLVVRTVVEEQEQVADVPLMEETIEVQHVPVDRIVEGPVPVRQEGDTIIVPVLEEVLIVEKKLHLREEVHVIRHRKETHRPQKVTLRKEEAIVERTDNPRAPPTVAQDVSPQHKGRSP